MIAGFPYEVVNRVPMTVFDGPCGSRLYLVHTMAEWRAFFALLMKQKLVAADTETSGFEWYHGKRIVGMSFGWSTTHFYIPVRHEDSCLGGVQPAQLSMDDLRDDLRAFFSRTDVTTLAHNWKFDAAMYRADGIEWTAPFHDTALMWHLYNENAPAKLKTIASGWKDKETGLPHAGIVGPEAAKYEKDLDRWRADEARARKADFMKDVKAKAVQLRTEIEYQDMTLPAIKKLVAEELQPQHRWSRFLKEDVHYGFVPIDTMTKYAATDAYLTWRVFEYVSKHLQFTEQLTFLYQNELKLSRVLLDAECGGAKIDRDYLVKLRDELSKEVTEQEAVLRADLGDINIRSGAQLAAALKARGCDLGEADNNGKPSTNKRILKKLRADHPVVDVLTAARNTAKLRDTYTTGILDKLTPDNWLHMGFNQNVSTGRMSSREPNCFTGDTEVLTPDGWARLDALPPTAKVAQWVPASRTEGALEFVAPTDYVAFTGTEGKPIINLLGDHVRFKVTADHRMVVRSKTDPSSVKTAPASAVRQHHVLPHGGNLGGTTGYTAAELEIAACLMSLSFKRKDGAFVMLSSNKERVARLTVALKELQLLHRILPSSSHPGATKVSFVPKWPAKFPVWLDSDGYGHFHMREMLDMNVTSKKLLLELISFWCKRTFYQRNRPVRLPNFSTEEDARAYQTLSACVGRRVAVRYASDALRKMWPRVGAKGRWFCAEETSPLRYPAIRLESDGKHDVYCVSVPSTFLLVRTNGFIAVSGNCQNIPRKDDRIRRAFIVPSDEYLFILSDFCLEGSTLVDTPTGHKQIKDIEVGDLVFTYNHATKRPDCSKVSGKVATGNLPTMLVELDNGEKVRCTPNHRWLLVDGTECYARHLRKGASLLASDLCLTYVAAVTMDGLVVPTFDIEVERDHNFALAAGVFVHNSQVEVRLTAHYSEDPLLLDSYAKKQDVHTRTMCEMFGYNYDEASAIIKDEEHPMHKMLDQLRSVAKCVHPYTLIHTDKGMQHIGDLPFADKEGAFLPHKGTVRTPTHSAAKRSQTFNGGRKPLLHVVTNRSVVTCSANHLFQTGTGLVKASKLKAGNYLAAFHSRAPAAPVAPAKSKKLLGLLLDFVDHAAHAPFPEALLALPAANVAFLAEAMFAHFVTGVRCQNKLAAGQLMGWLGAAGVQAYVDWFLDKLEIRPILEEDKQHLSLHMVLGVFEAGEYPCVDITVDTKDHLYVTNGVVTHNTINFGIIYGVSDMGLSEQIPRPAQYADLSHRQWVKVCAKYIEDYFDKYRGVRRFINQSGRDVRRDCEVVNYFGRVRHLPTAQADKLLGPDKFWMVARAKRQGTNSLIQGTAADVFKIAAVRVYDILQAKAPRSRLVNFVHDEVQIYMHKEETGCLNDIRDAMQDFDFLVPLVVDFSWSKTNWADKRKLG